MTFQQTTKFYKWLLALTVAATAPTPATVASEEHVVFSFDKPESAEPWQTVNDGVMGGRSAGRFKINQQGNMVFSGTLSLENNGGFASVRAADAKLDLKTGDAVTLRVRGDGRQYYFNLYVPRNSGGYSYRQPFNSSKGEWVEPTLPLEKFVATFRGRVFPDEKLDPSRVTGMGILLADGQAGPFELEVAWIKAGPPLPETDVTCEGAYPKHLQGICVGDDAIYWCFTTNLVKTDFSGKLLKAVPVADHHGDLCWQDGKLYVAVNLGKFNDPEGNADSWVYVYDADTLDELSRHETQEVFHGAGGIGVRDGQFYVVGGLPDGIEENYVYQYDKDFSFVKKHVIDSGHTHLGIQTAAFAEGRWWFGCYGDPKILLVTDADFQMQGRYEFDASLGIVGLSNGQLLAATGRCEKGQGCTGRVRQAIPDQQDGLILNASSRSDSP